MRMVEYFHTFYPVKSHYMGWWKFQIRTRFAACCFMDLIIFASKRSLCKLWGEFSADPWWATRPFFECSILRKMRMRARYTLLHLFRCLFSNAQLQLICVCARIRLATEISPCCGFRCKGNTLHLSCRPIPTPSCCEEASPWAPLTFPPSPSWPQSPLQFLL